jgi:hypothetical protein
MTFLKTPFSKKILVPLLIICLIGLATGQILLYPKTAKAQWSVYDVVHTPLQVAWEGLKSVWRAAMQYAEVWENSMRLGEWGFGVLLDLLLHQILAQLTNDIVAWIQNDEEPRFLSMNFEDWLKTAADNAVGNFIDQYLGAGWLCEPFDLDVRMALIDVPDFEEKVDCTLDDVVGNIDDFYDDFSVGGWDGWLELTNPKHNFYGAVLLAQDEKMIVEQTAKEERDKELAMGDGALAPKDCYWYDDNGNLVETQEDVFG